jgi:hypothetical protein
MKLSDCETIKFEQGKLYKISETILLLSTDIVGECLTMEKDSVLVAIQLTKENMPLFLIKNRKWYFFGGLVDKKAFKIFEAV